MGSSFAGTDNATPCGFLIDSLTINIRSSDESYQIKIGANDKSAPLPAVVIVEELDACFVVRDPEQALVYFNVINDALALDGKAHLSFLSTQSRFCSTAPPVWLTFHSYICAEWKPNIQVCTFLRNGGSVRDRQSCEALIPKIVAPLCFSCLRQLAQQPHRQPDRVGDALNLRFSFTARSYPGSLQ
jgi:hypothetical protein